MINLLSQESKQELRAARTNVTLINYMFVLALGVAFLVTISVGVYFILLNTQTDAQNLMKATQAKNSANASVQAQEAALTSSLASAKTVLDQQSLYTNVLTTLAGAMPSGVVLDGINLTPALFGTPTTLQFYAKTNAQALALKNSLAASPMFSNISFLTLANGTTQSGNYPVSVSLSLTINKAAAE